MTRRAVPSVLVRGVFARPPRRSDSPDYHPAMVSLASESGRFKKTGRT